MSLRSSTRFLLAVRTLCLDAALIVLIAGCLEKNSADETGTSSTGANSNPSIDVRGGNSDSDTGEGRRVEANGDGGNGGSINVVGGAVTISDAALVAVAPAQTFAGNGLDVPSGEKITFASSLTVDFLRVQEGGELKLLDDTLLTVNGDVLIAGRVNGRGDKHFLDGRTFAVVATGSIVVTGSIDCGGFRKELEDLPPSERFDAAGGRGGSIRLQTPGAVFITGSLRADGGHSFSTDPRTTLPGSGGQITIEGNSLATSGRFTARGGNCYFVFDGNEPAGGTVTFTIAGAIEMAAVRELNASGGNASGLIGGSGGTILLQGGGLDLSNFDIENRGGDSTFLTPAEAGVGGTVTFQGNLTMANVTTDAGGGNATFRDAGLGGAGGEVIIVGGGGTVAPDVVLLVEGGDSLVPLGDGGTGGSLQVVSVDFQGAATVEAGISATRNFGDDGTICAEGLNAASLDKLQGTNNVVIATDCPITP